MIAMVFDFFGIWSRREKAVEQTSRTHTSAVQQDHVLAPKKVGDTLIGHDGAVDRFVFDDPSFSLGVSLNTSDAVRVKNFNPKEGDVLDFSGLSQELSFSGHTPRPYAVWVERFDNAVSHYPLKMDLDGDPRSAEMEVLLAPTSADMEPWKMGVPGRIMLTGNHVDTHKTMTDDMFIFA